MRRCRAPVAVLMLVLISMLVTVPASAGGPTSVLLVSPGTGETASLYAGDAYYEALAGLVGAFEAGGVAGTVDRSQTPHEVGSAVTVTWLIHDVQVWRVDRVYVGADHGPWISTQSAVGGSSTIWDSPVVWHTATDGRELAALLARLGVGSAPTGDTSATASAPTLGAGAADPDTGPRSAGGLVWGLAGLALGVALAAATVRLRSSLEPALDHAEPSWPMTDQLSSPSPRR